MDKSFEYEKHYGENLFRPEQIGLIVFGKHGKLLCNLYTAGGGGLHPTVILFHGIPGCEQNLDIAQDLRSAGFHVMTFHYSGSWGSGGDYSISNDLDDANTILDYVLNDKTYNFDKDRIYAVGHSLGGFVCAKISEERKEIKAASLLMPCNIGRIFNIENANPKVAKAIKDVLDESADWLTNVKPDQLYKEAIEHRDEFSIETNAKKLINKPLLIITGSLDDCCPKEYHAKPLIDAIELAGGNKVKDISYQTDHSFSDYRKTISHDVVEFLLSVNK